jgi:hypothetical protein
LNHIILGFLESLDDFYQMSSKLIMLQTTNNVFNTSLYSLVTPQSLLAWHRVRLANMMAHDGEEWATIFSENNSGLYIRSGYNCIKTYLARGILYTVLLNLLGKFDTDFPFIKCQFLCLYKGSNLYKTVETYSLLLSISKL